MGPLKIATLVPAYKSRHIKNLLKSLSEQSYRSFDCYVGDDSPDGGVRREVESFEQMGIANFPLHVLEGPQTGAALNNIRHLLGVIGEEYQLVHIMFDDDVLMPDFYSHHVALHQKSALCVTASARYTINDTGRVLGQPALPKEIHEARSTQLVLTDRYVAETTIPKFDNWVGEYSNMVFKNSCESFFGHWGDNLFHYGLGDLSAAIFSGPKLGFINKRLGGFRLHEAGMTAQWENPTRKSSLLAWVAVAQTALEARILHEQSARRCIEAVRATTLAQYPGDPELRDFAALFEKMQASPNWDCLQFKEKWYLFLKRNMAGSFGSIMIEKFL